MERTAWRCSRCGAFNQPDAKKCAECGKWPTLFDLQDTKEDATESATRETPTVPTAPPERSPGRRWRRYSFLVIWLLVALYVAGQSIRDTLLESGPPPVTPESLAATAGATTQPFDPRNLCDVYVVPLDRPSETVSQDLARTLSRRASVHACATPSFSLHQRAVDMDRKQIGAGDAFGQLGTAYRAVWPERLATSLGITEHDLYSSMRPNWRFVFGFAGTLGRPQGVGVISTARMGGGADGFRRLETMAMRYVGFQYYGLPYSSDPTSALYTTILGLADLDRMRPRFSDPSPSEKELRAARARFIKESGSVLRD